MNVHESNWLGVHQASEILGVSSDTIRRWAKKSLIQARRSAEGYRLFSLEELERVRNKYCQSSPSQSFEILTAPKTSFTAIELFSGCGGMALGFENAGLNTQLLVEIVRDACDTLRQNRPTWSIKNCDIAEVDFSSHRDAIDIVSGGTPCQSFSYAGLGKGFDDVRGTLFFQFARCVNEVRPKIAVLENVRGLIRHDNGKTLQTMLRVLDEIGYRTSYKLLRSQFFDVPQKRERIFIIAVRQDLDLPIAFPKEKDYTISLREALNECPSSPGTKYAETKKKVMDLVPPGGYWRDLPINVQKHYMKRSYFLGGGKTGMARRLSWDEPSLTLTCSPCQKQTERCHPKETRPLTIREYARIQSFPDSWKFMGSISSQYRQIGNAVPVNLAFHIGSTLIDILNGKIEEETSSLNSYEFKKTSCEQLTLAI
jgi:DNA (cytosine-5)-methyltransferase 1